MTQAVSVKELGGGGDFGFTPKSSVHSSPVGTLDSFIEGHQHVLISGGYDGRVIRWDQGWQPRWSLLLPDIVNHISICSSIGVVAAACADGYVYGLNLADGSLQFKLGPHQDDVNSVCWHPSGEYLISVADFKDSATHLWDIKRLNYEGQMYSHEAAVYSVVFDPSGERFATSGADHTVNICDFESRRILCELRHQGTHCETVIWSPDGLSVLTGCSDGRIIIWDALTGQQMREKQVASSAVRQLIFSNDENRILAGSYDGNLRVIDVNTLEVIESLTAEFQWERSALFFDEKIVVASFLSAPICHYPDLQEKLTSYSKPAPTKGINIITGNDQHVLVGRDDGSVIDLESQQVLYQHQSIVNDIAIDPSNRWFASGDYQGTLIVYCNQTRTIFAELSCQGGPVNALAWGNRRSGDKELCLISGGYDGHIRWWSPSLELLHKVKAHNSPIKSLSYCPISEQLIAGSSDNTTSCWSGIQRIYTGTDMGIELINNVCISPRGDEFASASRDGQIRIWSLASGKVFDRLPKIHDKSIKTLAYSPDGEMMISGSYDATGIIWFKKNEQWDWKELKHHSKPGLASVHIGTNNLFTAGWDGQVAKWDRSGNFLHQYTLSQL